MERFERSVVDRAMVTERLQNLASLWSWLPAFRVVAEAEHLPTAARLLGVGPSTLSRAIAQLERAVAKPLFARVGRSLRLNPAGREMLHAVRDAMRRLDDGLVDVGGTDLRGAFVIASSGAGTTAVVAPALAALLLRHPALEPQLVTRAADETADLLLRGLVDVAFQESAGQRTGLHVTKVATLPRSVYCGASHPLFAARDLGAAALADAAFVAPPAAAEGRPADGWPAELPRRVAIECDQIRVGVELCRTLPLLAVLPDTLGHDAGLRRLPIDVVAPSCLFAIQRRPLVNRCTPAGALVELALVSAGRLVGAR